MAKDKDTEEPKEHAAEPAAGKPEGKEQMKTWAAAALVFIALGMAYYFLYMQPPPIAQESPQLKLGSEIDMKTFAALLSKEGSVSIITDLRNASNSTVRMNIQNCGTGFAGGVGIGGKNKTIYTLDSDSACVAGWEQNGTVSLMNYSTSECLARAEGGLSILVHEGNTTKFYTNAMVVGVGANYSGECNIK